MPRYQCHKEVDAFEIGSITEKGWDYVLRPKDESLGPVLVDADWFKRHKPQPGGYFVIYDDSYSSYSPKAAFEAGYTLLAEPLPAPAPGGELADAPQPGGIVGTIEHTDELPAQPATEWSPPALEDTRDIEP